MPAVPVPPTLTGRSARVIFRRVRNRFHRRSLREATLAWVVPVLLFRALIPVGFMPGQTAAGALTVELCSGMGYQQSVVHFAGDGQPLPDRGSHDPCPFAASAGGAPPPSDLPQVAIAFAAGPAALPPDTRFQYVDPARRPTARAPPSFA